MSGRSYRERRCSCDLHIACRSTVRSLSAGITCDAAPGIEDVGIPRPGGAPHAQVSRKTKRCRGRHLFVVKLRSVATVVLLKQRDRAGHRRVRRRVRETGGLPGILPDGAGLVGVEVALTGRAVGRTRRRAGRTDDAERGAREADRVAGRARRQNRGAHAAHRVPVPALTGRARIRQVRADERLTAHRRRRQLGERIGVSAAAAAGRERRLRAVQRAHRADRRRLVTRHAGTEQPGDGNCRNDADDRHDNQQLDEGETLVTSHSLHKHLLESARAPNWARFR